MLDQGTSKVSSNSSLAAAILTLGWPMLVSSLAGLLIGIVDAAVVGRLGIEHLAGAAAALAIFAVASETISATLTGFQISIARLVGAEDRSSAYYLFVRFLAFAFAVGIGGMLLLLFVASYARVLTHDALSGELAATYLQFRSPAIVISAVTGTLRTTLDVQKKTRPGMYAALISNALNLLLAPVLALGIGGGPALGIAGAGVAATIASLGALLVIVFFWLRERPIEKVLHHTEIGNKSADLTQTLKLSSYEVMNASLDYIGNLVFIAIIGMAGTAALAVNRVAFSLLLICFVTCGSIATAAQILMARESGAGRQHNVEAIFKASLFLIPAIGAPFFLLFIFAPDLISMLYVGSTHLGAILHPVLIVLAITIVPLSLNSAFVARLRALRANRSVMYLNLAAIWFVQLPLAWLLVRHFDMSILGAYYSVLLYFTARAAGAVLLIRSRIQSQIINPAQAHA